MKPGTLAATIVATAFFLSACAPAPPPEQALSDAEARTIIEGMMKAWDEAVAAGDTDVNMSIYTEDAIRMQPDMPALAGRDAIRAWMEAQREAYSAEGTNEIVEVRALSNEWILFRTESSFTVTARAGGEPRLEDEKWLSIAQRQPDGSWMVYRDAGSRNMAR